MVSSNRIKTGIKGFDELFDGGFLRESVSLLSGAPGTGKTIFSLAFLHNGAKEFNQKGIYVTFEQPEKDLIEQAKQFGWDLQKLQKENKINIVSIPVQGVHKETLDMIAELVEESGAQRLIIDSLSTLNIAAPYYTDHEGITSNSAIEKYFIYTFVDKLRTLDCTTLLISELRHDGWLGKDTTAEFVVDNVIILKYFGAKGSSSRTMAIKKARKTKFDENIHPFEFTDKGIEIKNTKKVAMKFKES